MESRRKKSRRRLFSSFFTLVPPFFGLVFLKYRVDGVNASVEEIEKREERVLTFHSFLLACVCVRRLQLRSLHG